MNWEDVVVDVVMRWALDNSKDITRDEADDLVSLIRREFL